MSDPQVLSDLIIKINTVWQLIGFPSLFAICIFFVKICKKHLEQINTLMKAQKAQMRAQLLKDFNYYSKRGWIGDAELQEWSNQYTAYHNLVGENGVLDDRYQQLIRLPNTPPKKQLRKKCRIFRVFR